MPNQNSINNETGLFYRYNEGTHAWQEVAGGLATSKGRMMSVIPVLLLGGAPWWLSIDTAPLLYKVFTFSAPLAVWIIVAVVLVWIAFLMGSNYLQKRSIRSLKMKHELHRFTHALRDEYMRAQKGTIELRDTSDRLCRQLQEYFRLQTKRNDISVAIRIARKKGNTTVYETMGRAGLNPQREATSEALSEDMGVARLMRHSPNHALYFPDVKTAAEAGDDVYYVTDNDRNYSNDVRSLMVGPINGWDGEDDSMLGMLFVGSQKACAFGKIYTDCLMFVGDALANLYSEFASQAAQLEGET